MRKVNIINSLMLIGCQISWLWFMRWRDVYFTGCAISAIACLLFVVFYNSVYDIEHETVNNKLMNASLMTATTFVSSIGVIVFSSYVRSASLLFTPIAVLYYGLMTFLNIKNITKGRKDEELYEENDCCQ